MGIPASRFKVFRIFQHFDGLRILLIVRQRIGQAHLSPCKIRVQFSRHSAPFHSAFPGVVLKELMGDGLQVVQHGELLMGNAEPAVGRINQQGLPVGKDDGAIVENKLALIVQSQMDVKGLNADLASQGQINLANS